MEFIARAGALIDRSHRIVGVLLVIVILQTFIIISQHYNNQGSENRIARLERTFPVYVVPGSIAGIFRPESSDNLTIAFTDFIIQSLHTYTYESYESQYLSVKQFFTAQMLRYADTSFGKRIKDAQSIRMSEIFIPNRQTLRLSEGIEDGEKLVVAMLRGSVQKIISGNVVETSPVEITLKMRRVLTTKVNPFGLTVHRFKVKEIKE